MNIDELLTKRADAAFDRELHRMSEKYLSDLDALMKGGGAYSKPQYKSPILDSEGRESQRNFAQVMSAVTESAKKTFREEYRQNFRDDFIRSVSAMREQMESYIGELQESPEA